MSGTGARTHGAGEPRVLKAVTICQPYAHLIVVTLEKIIENRTWPTSYRGPLAIHAGKSRAWLDDGDEQRYPDMVFGAVIGIVTLADCVPVDRLRRPWVDNVEHANGPWCWCLCDVRRLPMAVHVRGAQGLWNLPPDISVVVKADLGRIHP